MDDNYYMNIALREAKLAADEGEVPVGAVVVCNGQIIAKSHNQTERLGDVTAHAEMLALTAAANVLGGKYLNDCTLYVTLEPCTMCAGAMRWCQLGRVVFGADDVKNGYRRFAPNVMHPKTVVDCGIMCEECSRIVSEFFKERRNNN